MDGFEHGAKEALTGLSERLGDAKEDWKELRKGVKDAQSSLRLANRKPTSSLTIFDANSQSCSPPSLVLSNPTQCPTQIVRDLIEPSPPSFPSTTHYFLSFP
jgi:hypothetical protein